MKLVGFALVETLLSGFGGVVIQDKDIAVAG